MERIPGLKEAVACFEKNLGQKFLKIERVVDVDYPEKTYNVCYAFSAGDKYVLKYDRTGYEYHIYKSFLTGSDLPVPACLDALQTGEGTWLLLSFVGAKSLVGADLQQYCEVAKALAKIHGFLADRVKGGGDLLKKKVTKIEENLVFIEQEADLPIESKRRIHKAATRLLTGSMTIIHDDLLPINIVAAGSKIFFIDWATASYGACAHDLGRLLGDLKDTQQSYWVKPDWWQTILQTYYNNREYDKKYKREEFQTDFQSACLWNYAEIVIAHQKNNWQPGDWYKANLQAIQNISLKPYQGGIAPI